MNPILHGTKTEDGITSRETGKKNFNFKKKMDQHHDNMIRLN